MLSGSPGKARLMRSTQTLGRVGRSDLPRAQTCEISARACWNSGRAFENRSSPWEENPQFDPADLSKYVVINIHASDVDKMAKVWEIAERCRLVAYDPLHRHT
jgi:hypothetical protein